MMRAIDGTTIFHAMKPGRLPERRCEYRCQTARELSTVMLKNRLCTLGPVKCPDCGLCEYGKEYARRTGKGANTVKQREAAQWEKP